MTIEPLIVLFTLGSPLFWLLVLVVSGCVIWAVEENRWYWAGFSVLAFLAACIFLGDTGIVKSIIERPYMIVPWAGGFVGLGITWGFVKWFAFLHKRRRKYEDAKLTWLREQGLLDAKDVPEELKEKWTLWLLNSNDWSRRKVAFVPANKWDTEPAVDPTERVLTVRPRAWENKTKIITWMAFWPWSLFWYLLGDLLHDLWNRIYSWLGDLFEQMSKHVFRNISADVVEIKKATPPSPEEVPEIRNRR